jgi:hypothetical protein
MGLEWGDEKSLWVEYHAAAEDMYASLGLAEHGETGDVVAFVTPSTVEAIERFHRASMAICASRGEIRQDKPS